jgi:hypothetical protein
LGFATRSVKITGIVRADSEITSPSSLLSSPKTKTKTMHA